MARFYSPVNMMSTFRDILSDFESVQPMSCAELLGLAADKSHVDNKPDVTDEVDGVSRWCSGCEEYWPLDTGFFSRRYKGSPEFISICRACVKESESQAFAQKRIPANVAGPLTVYFPEVPAKTCASCQRIYPYLALFWRQDEAGALTNTCASCLPSISPLAPTEISSHAI